MTKYECSWTELHQAVIECNDPDDVMEMAQTLKKDTCIHIENHGYEKQ